MKSEDTLNETMKKGFDIFKKEYVTLILGTLLALVMMIFIVTIPPMIFGIYQLCIQAVNGKKIQVTDVFKGFSYFWRSWGIMLLAIIAIAFGLVLLIIPGLILMVLYQYAVAIAIIEDKGVVASLKRSYEIGKKNFKLSIIFWIVMGVISSIGGLTRAGVLLTLPFTALCTIILTKKLAAKTKA